MEPVTLLYNPITLSLKVLNALLAPSLIGLGTWFICQSCHLLNLFLTCQPESSLDVLITLIDMIDQSEGVHKIKTHLFSVSLPQLSSLQEIALESTNTDFSSAEYRVTSIILDIPHHRLFKPVKSDVPAENPKHFMKIKFLPKGIDAINLPQLLRSQSVMDKIPA